MDDDIRFEPVRSTLLDVEPPARARRRPARPATELVELGPDPFPADRRRTKLALVAVAAMIVAVTAVVWPLVALGGGMATPLPSTGVDSDLPDVPVYVSASAPAPATSDPSGGPTPIVSRSPSPGPTSGPSPKPSGKPPRKPTSPGVPPTKAAPPPPPPVTSYDGIAGPGCPTLRSAGYVYNGWYTNGRLGWVTDTAGSWTGNGCTGAWASMPMSGSNTPDSGISTQWWFVTGFATGTCSVDAYIPKGTRSWDSWGDPAYYQVLRSRTDSTVIATFTVGQKWGAAWASVGTFPFTKGELVIKLLDRGTNNPDGQKLALGPVRVSCSA